jgi:hypothetical protein
MPFCIAIATLVILLLLPDAQAHAWGPGVHMAVGNWFLANLDCVALDVGRILSLHPGAFLYGSLAADIFIGKGSTVRPGHSHNWATGLSLLARADNARTRSYAYGYLAHLAADTVAHNHFVPEMLCGLPAGGRLGHVYIEMQADARVSWDTGQARELFASPQHDTDAALLATVRKRRWPFLLKKQVIKGHLSLCGRRRWDQSLDVADRVVRLGGLRYFQDMFALTLDAVGDFLARPGESPVMELDPIGSAPLGRAAGLRRLGGRPGRRTGRAPGGLFPLPGQLASLPRLHDRQGNTEIPLRRAG